MRFAVLISSAAGLVYILALASCTQAPVEGPPSKNTSFAQDDRNNGNKTVLGSQIKKQFGDDIVWDGPLVPSDAGKQLPPDVAVSERWKEFTAGDSSKSYCVVFELCIPGAHPEDGPVETYLMVCAVVRVSPEGKLAIFRW